MKRVFISIILSSLTICQILGQDLENEVIDNSLPPEFEAPNIADNQIFLVPKTSIKSINNTIVEYFSRERSIAGKKSSYRQTKLRLEQHFNDLGLNTITQDFQISSFHQQRYGENATNIIGIWPGPKRGTDSDEIIVIGAHYDSAKFAPGVEDDGSGSASVLEIAKLITKNKCTFDKTLIFVLFDMEEQGLYGSRHFVNHYLIPIEVTKNRAKVVGAIIIDMILEYDTTPNSQYIDTISDGLPEWVEELKKNQFRGDFVAIWARKGFDSSIYDTIKKNWMNGDKYGLSLMATPWPEFKHQMDSKTFSTYSTFSRSDHFSFWYPIKENITFPAVLVTDNGAWRRGMRDHYHRPSDDTRSLTEGNLSFLKNTINSIVRTIFDLSDGKCRKLQ